MAKHDNPKHWKPFDVIRKDKLIEVWIPPVAHPEGEIVIKNLHIDYIPSLIAALKKFEQSEGR